MTNKKINDKTVMIKNIFSFKTIVLAFVGMVCLGVQEAQADPVAHVVGITVGNKDYDEYFAAFGDVVTTTNGLSEATITLLDDVDHGSLWSIVSGDAITSLTLDLNGHTLSYTGTGQKFLHINKSGVTVRIKDSSSPSTGKLKYDGSYSGFLIGVSVAAGNLILESGEIYAKNSYTSDGTYGIEVSSGLFTMRGGKLTSIAYSGSRGVRVTGSSAKAVIENGTVDVSTTDASNAYALNAVSNGKIEVYNGTFTALAKTSATSAIFAEMNGKIDVKDGTFSANSTSNSYNNIDVVRVYKQAEVNIYGGSFSSTTGSTCYAVLGHGGTTNIYDGTFTAKLGIFAGEYSFVYDDSVKITIHGGRFYTTGSTGSIMFYSSKRESGTKKEVGKLIVNGGYFYHTSGTNLAKTVEGAVLKFYGGYYKQNATHREQLDTYKGDNTTVQDLSPTVSEDGKTYKYTLNHNFNQEADVYIGTSTTPTHFEHFADAWTFAKELRIAKIQLMKNEVSSSDQLQLTSADGFETLTLDLNGKTLSYSTESGHTFVYLNKTGAHLRIMDSSSPSTGKLKFERSYNGVLRAVGINAGELILESGTIYAHNTNDGASYNVYCVQQCRNPHGVRRND